MKKLEKKKSLYSVEDLAKHSLIKPTEVSSLKTVAENFSISITPDMYNLIDPANPDDPISKQFVPSTDELNISLHESQDPIGDHVFTTVKGIIHRYPDRCLFSPVHVCPVYCRFCFRREKVGANSETLSPVELEAAYQYIKAHPALWEVILTGGDPFILKPSMFKKIIDQLNTIDHVEVIRIHTRIPVVDPARINAEMIAALKNKKTVYVSLHANHPREFTVDAIRACTELVDAGIPMLSQTTLLKGVNDNIETLSALMRCFIKHRIKPYYLHQGDLAKGTQHFRTTIETGQSLMKQLRGRFSGICQPTYVLDIPGGYGKVPINQNYMTTQGNEGCYCVEDYQGNTHAYSEDAIS